MKKFLIMSLLILILPMVLALDDCPYGEIDCEGKCGKFVDVNQDGFCDHSQPKPIMEEIDPTTFEISEQKVKQQRVYHLIPISLLTTILYLITFILSKKKIMSYITHKKIWNVLLLITFLISGILGILLIIRINFGIVFPSNFLFLHVEVGIAMFVICFFHVLEHWYYFRNLIFTKK